MPRRLYGEEFWARKLLAGAIVVEPTTLQVTLHVTLVTPQTMAVRKEWCQECCSAAPL